MAKFLKCSKCSLCAIGFETGFTGGELLYCSNFGRYVSRDDGCTFGVKGKPQTLGSGLEMMIAGHESVWGYRDE